MARRRDQPSPEESGELMPRELLAHEKRGERRAWLEARGLFSWRQQNEATRAARRAHGIPEVKQPDPRVWLGEW